MGDGVEDGPLRDTASVDTLRRLVLDLLSEAREVVPARITGSSAVARPNEPLPALAPVARSKRSSQPCG